MTRVKSAVKDEQHTKVNGFTLVELLVVVGVIAVLIGILLPVLSKTRRQAQMTVELSAARQLMLGYLIYTNDNNGALIPGYIELKLPRDAAVWPTDDTGQPFNPTDPFNYQVADRWPWRLRMTIKASVFGTLLVGDQAINYSDRNQPMWAYYVSVFPSFGMNLYNIGGDLHQPLYNHRGYLKKITQSRYSSRLIVFASAWTDANTKGNFQLRPPRYRTYTWPTSRDWPDHPFSQSDQAIDWGYVHPRWDGRAIVACLDGHAEPLTVDELRDMTRWSESAARAGDPNYAP